MLAISDGGANAQVYRAEWRNMQSVAVKQLKQHDARNDIRFLREIAILKECRSGHVVQFLVRSLLTKGLCPFSVMWQCGRLCPCKSIQRSLTGRQLTLGRSIPCLVFILTRLLQRH